MQSAAQIHLLGSAGCRQQQVIRQWLLRQINPTTRQLQYKALRAIWVIGEQSPKISAGTRGMGAQQTH